MYVFDALFKFIWSLLDLSVYIDGIRFSLGGAIIFAFFILLFVGFLYWLFDW